MLSALEPLLLTPSCQVVALTFVQQHTCLKGDLANAVLRGEGEFAEDTAAKLQPKVIAVGGNRRATPGPQLVSSVRAEFEAAARLGIVWDKKKTLCAIRNFDPTASGSMASYVLRKLQQPTRLAEHFKLELLQGLAVALVEVGFGVVLHLTDANGIVQQIMDIASKRYLAICRKKGTKPAPFKESVMASLLEEYDVNDTEEKYVVGWTLVNCNMMPLDDGQTDQIRNFIPVDAVDCSGMRGRAQGIMTVRATKDANDNIHPISISRTISAESSLGVGAHFHGESRCLGEANSLLMKGRVSLMDGGHALHSRHASHHPDGHQFRCSRHIIADLDRQGGRGEQCYLTIQPDSKTHSRTAEWTHKHAS